MDPQTPEQWQEAVNQAQFWLLVDAARGYGLIKGGPPVDVERCVTILMQGEERGIQPQDEAIEAYARFYTGKAEPGQGEAQQ